MSRRVFLPFVLLFIMGASWGLQLVLIKVAAVDGFEEFAILTVALLTLAPLYAMALAIRRQLFLPSGQHLWFFFVSGTLGYTVPLVAVAFAARALPAGLIAAIVALTPMVTVIGAAVLGTERIGWLRRVAVGFGLVASALLLAGDVALPAPGLWVLLVVAFLAPLAYGFDAIYVGARWPGDLNALQVVTGEAAVSGVVLLMLTLFLGDFSSFGGGWSVGHSAVAGFVAVSVIEVFLFFYLVRTEGAVLVSFGNIISLVTGIFWGALIFGERLPAVVWVSVGALVIGLLLVAADARRGQGIGTSGAHG
ncbi:MAG: DMT family transporter [Pseudomonadota bacterium]